MPTQLDIPNLDVLVTNDLQTKRVIIRQPATIVGYSPIPIDISHVASASYAETASIALNAVSIPWDRITNIPFTGSKDTLVLWGASGSLTSSFITQKSYGYHVGRSTEYLNDTFHTATIVIDDEDNNLHGLHARGNVNNFYSVLVSNDNLGVSASADFRAAIIDEVTHQYLSYIDVGVNGEHYAYGQYPGAPLDSYMFSKGGNLLIGSLDTDYGIIIFAGGADAIKNARMYIDPGGTISINTSEITSGAPETLFIQGIDDNSYNLITALATVDSYVQFNLKNKSTGSYASSDIVVTADVGTEWGNYVDFGINNSNYHGDYPGDYGSALDAYFYVTSSGHFFIGDASRDGMVHFFAGGTDFYSNSKMEIRADNFHNITGSLDIQNQMSSSVLKSKKFLEYNNIRDTQLSGTVQFDTLNHSLIYYTQPAAADWEVNFRGNGTTSLNDTMEVGQNMTVAMMITNGSPAYYAVAHLIDGVSITPRWQGSAPTGGMENAMEIYSYSIVKTADATFTLIAAKVNFS